MKKTIKTILIEVAHGDFLTLIGLVDHLTDHGYGYDRIAKIAWKHFHVPEKVTLETITHLV